ncbi:MAG: hypothetical protein PHC85_02015 [Candidatus Pacebacteria bacterium]|nr:hypothetical protein [Candidatus Paceibacterota bacterium]
MESDLKEKIMRRVYAIWFFRKVAPAVFLYMPFLAAVAFRETAREFFVARIVDNFLQATHVSGFFGAINFVFAAIENTPVLPTLVIAVSLGFFVLLLRKLAYSIKDLSLERVRI